MRRTPLPTCLFAIVPALVTSPVFAAISGDGLLNDVTNRFLTQSATWGAAITTYATWLFWVLATISMVWTFGMLALRKADIAEFFAEFIRFTVVTGFFWWLLSHGPTMAMAIINSLRKIGSTAGGLPIALTPSTPISIGFDIVKKAFTGLSWIHPVDNLAIVLVSAAVVVCMAVVAANVLITLVTAWTMAYAGTFILGFGGARWTSDMAIGYFKAMLGIGLELMTMTLLVGIATSVIDGFYVALDGSSVYELLLVFCVCAVLALLIGKIPARVGSLVGGGVGSNVGAGAMMGGAAMAGAALATAGAALATATAAGASGIAGGAQALMAAFTKANAAESAGGGSGGALIAGGGDTGSKSSSGGGSALASAMGDSGGGSGGASAVGAAAAKVGRVAAGTASNLAQGSWDVAKAKAGDVVDSARERIGDTTGGKIATAIQARDAAARESAGTSTTFDNNSLGAGADKAADAVSEVAAFRDRKSQI